MPTRHGLIQTIARLLAVLLAVLAFAASADARDVFVVLSGGVSAEENNLSQYLQARAMVNFFQTHHPREPLWVFFGAGNVEGRPPVFGDVRRQTKQGDLAIDSWIPGALPHNLPARRDVILRALREEILPAIADGGTLFLFVGDHGSRAHGDTGESLIDLWGYERDLKGEHGWRLEEQTLGVEELRRTLLHGMGRGRLVFCMTQCHSGGFHYLGIPREMTANPNWFTQPPLRTKSAPEPLFPLAAGFTATDEPSAASGCDPDPDPEGWAGYERFLPECLLGRDLLSLKPAGHSLPSFAQAHAAATLVDWTIDKPRSTSDQYLEGWATLIETRLVGAADLKPAVRRHVVAYQRAVDGSRLRAKDPGYKERQAMFQRFINEMTVQNPGVTKLLKAGTRRDLERVAGIEANPLLQPADPAYGRGPEFAEYGQGVENVQTETNAPTRGRRGGRRGFRDRRLWNETLRPAWKAAVEANQASVLPLRAREFEKHLLAMETEARSFSFGRDRLDIDKEIFWNSGYSDPATVDLKTAETIARWGVERRAKILEWAKASDRAEVRAAATALARRRDITQPSAQPEVLDWPLEKETAAERALFYRRVLAAWEFLLAVKEKPALDRLRELTELERTPLPQGR